MTPPALAPLAVAAVIAAGPGAQAPVPREWPVIVGHTVAVVERAASATRGHGAGTAELAASSVAAPTTGGGRTARDSLRASGRPRAGAIQIRAPPR
jgi:hypothetical protein